MERSSEKRRAWVKNAAIIFLTFLLLLTFFSNTILNYSLPEVSAQYANSGTLTTAVKVDGTVKANESYKVIYEASQAETEGGVVQSRKVVSVFVKDGDMVEKDAPILALQGGMSEQLTKVQSEYDAAKREYDLALLQDVVDGLNADKTLDNAKQALEDEKKKLTELQSEYYALLGGADTKTLLEAKLEKLNAELEEIVERETAVTEKKTDVEGKIKTAPYVMNAASDSRFMSRVSDNCLRFAPFSISQEQFSSVHAIDENLDVDTLSPAVDFYKYVIENSGKI